MEELKFFQKKYSFVIKLISDNSFIIPEYKINLLNKTKKLINTFENIIKVEKKHEIKETPPKRKKDSKKAASKNKDKFKKKKSKVIRTLWVRRKKNN